MYKERAPDYLREMQPGNTEVRCRSLIQKIKDDKTTVGISGDVCMANIVTHYQDVMKKQDKKERRA